MMDFTGLDERIVEMLHERKRTMGLFTPDHRPLNMYGIYWRKLNMTADKRCAQLGHAFTKAYKNAERLRPAITPQYEGTGNGTKIVMYTDSLKHLCDAYFKAQEEGIPCELIIDRGHVIPGTAFDGDPIITALGIGPAYKDEVAQITKKFTMSKD